jgi:hypothetical protein
MRPKKSKEPKKYAVGGMIAGAALGLGQAGLGAYQMFQGQQAAKRIKEASTARPSEYAELLKQARNAELEQRRLEELNRAISTGISAAQQGGGRALVGALPGMVRAGDAGALDILGQRQAQTMQALQFAAQGSEREIGREFQREMMERQAAQSALEGGLQNIAGGLGQVGSAAVLGLQGAKTGAVEAAAAPTSMEDQARKETLASLRRTQRERNKIGESLVDLQGQLDDEQVPLLAASAPKIANILAPEEEFDLENKRFLLPSQMKQGGMVTGGKFDHKTNPIDIIQQGRKIGEMTGGEVILNPTQQKKLSKESAYFRQLLKKFNKQK